MGVVNVTPDSFSDGGRWASPEAAIAHGQRLHGQGADIIDVGGESTRPGAQRPTVTEECDRVLPVVAALAAEGVVVSIDTMRARVAEAAVKAGASLVNDVSGGRADADMFAVVAAAGASYILMHWRAHSQEMADHADYTDVVADVARELEEQLALAVAAGIPADRIALDPGIGFAKTADHNWSLLAGLPALAELGQPLLVGTSRKSFLGELLAEGGPPSGPGHQARSTGDRDDATLATSVLAAASGAWCIRTHRVRPSLDAVLVSARWARAERDSLALP